ILVRPTTENGLQAPSYLMVDKITTLRRTRLGQRVGELSAEDISRLAGAVLTFLGLATGSTASVDVGDL
ncbi:MAG: type II toxin-antitoxin system PemK/MazF family toxin, partial [Tepidiformaceae bacterium]